VVGLLRIRGFFNDTDRQALTNEDAEDASSAGDIADPRQRSRLGASLASKIAVVVRLPAQ
jgi:hypothetical protein